ncbi:MAG: phosphoglycerate dehydrogenase [Actinobacteria bacterium]|nr:phosphoglycerate dehydrogenase [Actinomycetota bacterium]
MAEVLITEHLADAGIELLAEEFQVDYIPGIKPEDLLKRISEYHALIVRGGTKVDADVIETAANLKIIGRAGVGVDNIDITAASRHGIMVTNAPQSNIISAAEQTMALLCSMCRNLPEAVSSLRERKWERKKFEGVELYHKVIGIIGIGRIGKLVAERCRAFGMQVIAFDPYVSNESIQRLGVELVSELDDVLSRADFISIHLPKNSETYHLLGKEEFEKMKDGVRVLNVARGGVMDEEALLAALQTGKVAGAGIDVFEQEPATDSPLIDHPKVIATPHLGASTYEAQDRAGIMIAEQVKAALKAEFVANVVNLPVPVDIRESVKLFMPLAEKLGLLLAQLAGGFVDEMEIEYLGSLAGEETGVLTLATLKGFFGKVVFEPVTYINAPIFAEEKGLSVKETKSKNIKDYLNLIMVTGRSGKSKVSVGGTLVGLSNMERVVHIYEYGIDMGLSEYMAIFRYPDIPGMIGKVGTICGNHGINITQMQVGRREIGGEAVMGINVDTPIPEDVMEEIRNTAGVREGKFITLS